MKLEVIQFWSRDYKDADARNGLPAPLRDELIEGTWGIQVNASKSEVIDDLEKVLRIGVTDDFVKYTYLEADESEISDYSHFFIRPQEFDWKDDVLFDTTPRQCATCSWEMKISSPIQFRSSALQGIGEIGGCPVLHTKLLLVTSELRELFDSEGVTGLKFEGYEDLDGSASPGFVAKVTHCAHQTGTKIIAKPCPDHSTIAGALVFDFRTPKDGLRNDFQMIDRVTVSGVDYSYPFPNLVVSQKMLRLLLDHDVEELESATQILDHVFRPLVVSDE